MYIWLNLRVCGFCSHYFSRSNNHMQCVSNWEERGAKEALRVHPSQVNIQMYATLAAARKNAQSPRNVK